MSEEEKALFKYNGGAGALLCSKCRTVLATGHSWKKHNAYYCDSCKCPECCPEQSSEERSRHVITREMLIMADRRVAYGRLSKPCTECGTEQVQLVDWYNEAVWKCRHCKHKWVMGGWYEAT